MVVKYGRGRKCVLTENYTNCVYLLLDTIGKTYYCGRADNFRTRLSGHPHNKTTDKIYILEQNCRDNTFMEYVWLYWLSHNCKKDWTCLNVMFSSGNKFFGPYRVFRRHYVSGNLKNTNYEKFSKNGSIVDAIAIYPNVKNDFLFDEDAGDESPRPPN